jgi:class 3 adenylate cyclase/HAMP domain-containing protein
MMKYYIPFRYKLTGIIAVIIAALLFAIFEVVQRDIELKFRIEIEARLLQAKAYVGQRMDDRYDLLYNDATALINDKLIRDIITDKTLSSLTRNDIVSAEVLPKFANLNVLAVTNTEGKLLAGQTQFSAITQAFIASEWYQYAMDGEAVAGFIFHEKNFYQGIAMPVFLAEGMIGIVVAGRTLTTADIAGIKKISDIDIAVLSKNARVIGTDFSGISEAPVLISAFDGWLKQVKIEAFVADDTLELKLGTERFLLQLSVDETRFVPPYIIARSLDEALEFATTLGETMQLLGSIGMVIAILIGFIFAVGVSTPIKRLAVATKQVAEENFAHRVNIRSKDEFSELGDSFNQMIIDLGEKQKIRSAFDKSVSKEVADHMLKQGAELGGTTQYATILFADIRGFTSLSEELDEKSLINLLNEYFSLVNSCIIRQQGVIDKFIGDAVMALFGTPIPSEHSAYSGLIAARDMLDTVVRFNKGAQLIYGCELDIGIGLNSGNVVAGLVGSDDRLNFTVLGDQVNIASRIEGLCKYYGIALILSESSVNDILECENLWTESVCFRLLDCVQVKGKTQGLKIYQPVFSADDEQKQQIKRYEQALAAVFSGVIGTAFDTLHDLIASWPDDLPTAKLYKACQQYLADPERFDHDYKNGVRIVTEK